MLDFQLLNTSGQRPRQQFSEKDISSKQQNFREVNQTSERGKGRHSSLSTQKQHLI